MLTEADELLGFLEEGMHGWPETVSPNREKALEETEKEARWITEICRTNGSNLQR